MSALSQPIYLTYTNRDYDEAVQVTSSERTGVLNLLTAVGVATSPAGITREHWAEMAQKFADDGWKSAALFCIEATDGNDALMLEEVRYSRDHLARAELLGPLTGNEAGKMVVFLSNMDGYDSARAYDDRQAAADGIVEAFEITPDKLPESGNISEAIENEYARKGAKGYLVVEIDKVTLACETLDPATLPFRLGAPEDRSEPEI